MQQHGPQSQPLGVGVDSLSERKPARGERALDRFEHLREIGIAVSIVALVALDLRLRLLANRGHDVLRRGECHGKLLDLLRLHTAGTHRSILQAPEASFRAVSKSTTPESRTVDIVTGCGPW